MKRRSNDYTNKFRGLQARDIDKKLEPHVNLAQGKNEKKNAFLGKTRERTLSKKVLNFSRTRKGQ